MMASGTPGKHARQRDAGSDSRAARARAERMAVLSVEDGVYDVVTETNHVYTVRLAAGACTCPDNRFRDARCKHLRRVALEITTGNVPAPGERDGTCATCDETVFTDVDADADADAAAPVYCADCTLRTGETVVDRETDRLVVVVDSLDERADEYEIPSRGWTVADHPTNDAYDARDAVVEVLYPLDRAKTPDDVAPRDLRRYAFPRGRLERRD